MAGKECLKTTCAQFALGEMAFYTGLAQMTLLQCLKDEEEKVWKPSKKPDK